MRRLLILVGFGLVASPLAPTQTASACDPNRPPFCMTVCNTVPPLYSTVRYRASQQDVLLPTWHQLGVPVCAS